MNWKAAALVLFAIALLVPFGFQYFDASEFTTVSRSITREKVPIAPGILADYVGTYRLRADFAVEVTVSDGKLFAQGTQQQKIEFHPASETVFFNEITPLLMKFERNGEGNVHQFRVLEPGQTRVAVRTTTAVDEA